MGEPWAEAGFAVERRPPGMLEERMQIDLEGFIAAVAKRKAYCHVIVKPVEDSNLVGVSGAVVGKKQMEALTQLGLEHGLHVFADRISVWFTQEDFERYGHVEPQISERAETRTLGSSGAPG